MDSLSVSQISLMSCWARCRRRMQVPQNFLVGGPNSKLLSVKYQLYRREAIRAEDSMSISAGKSLGCGFFIGWLVIELHSRSLQ